MVEGADYFAYRDYLALEGDSLIVPAMVPLSSINRTISLKYGGSAGITAIDNAGGPSKQTNVFAAADHDNVEVKQKRYVYYILSMGALLMALFICEYLSLIFASVHCYRSSHTVFVVQPREERNCCSFPCVWKLH